MIILFSLCLAVCLFFVFSFLISIVKKKMKTRKKIKIPKISFNSLSVKRKRIVIAIFVFVAVTILLQNIIYAIIISLVYTFFDWNQKDKARKKLINLIDKQVIEALNTIKSAVQSGQSLQKSITIASEELKEPIRSEFTKMSDELLLGESFDKVLIAASKNSLSNEFRLMIDTIRISKDSGASLSWILDNIIDATMQRIAIKSKVTALTAQGKMSGNIVSVIPFIVVFLMYLIEPDMMSSLFNTLAGNILLLIVVMMVLTGSFVIRKLTEIKI